MRVDSILQKASKYGYNINGEKYGAVINWAKEIKEVKLSRDREYLILLSEMEKEVDDAEIQWLKDHHKELSFCNEFEDRGFAFGDVLTIERNGTLVTTVDFYGDGEAEDFIEMICG
jgi:hypothetical protein